MQPRPRFRNDPPSFENAIPLLESGDLPGDDDWAILGPLRGDGFDDDDVERNVHPDFD